MTNTFIVCDLETTGFDPTYDKIIEAGMVRLEEGAITGQYHSLVNPGRPLPLKIKRLTNLADEDLAGSPEISCVLPEILEFIGDTPVVGHNIHFDLGFLRAAGWLSFSNHIYDTLELARLVVPEASKYRLDSLCTTLNIDFAVQHRALDDALATARLLNALICKLREIDFDVLTRLNILLREARSEWHGFIAELIRELTRALPERKISAPYWRRRDSRDDQLPQRQELSQEKAKYFLEEKEVTALVGKNGPLVAALPGYEYRPQQEGMVGQVTRALNEEKYLLMEAGTGVGKSIAYLIPSVLWSLLNKERVLIATHTINLQEQLWLKDIPMLAKVIGKPFKAVLAKGRQNYICLRRWFFALEGPHQPEEAAFYARVLTWLAVTNTGDRGELNVFFGECEFWLNICGESDSCLGPRCPYQSGCFINRAKREAEEADLIIANHSLLFSDVMAANMVLPAYGPLIIDEAHHLEESATSHLGRQLSNSSLNRWLGVAGKALSKLAAMAPPGDWAKWSKTTKEALATRLEALESVRLFFQLLWEMAASTLSVNSSGYSRASLRLPCNDVLYIEFLGYGIKCIEFLRRFTGEIKSCVEIMEEWAITEEAWAGPSRDLTHLTGLGQELIGALQFILDNEDQGYVYWAELEFSADGQARHCSLLAAPVDVGLLLHECLFKNKSTVVFTSATLTVNGTFDYFIERNGLGYLPEEKLVQMQYDSPFAYHSQALLCVSRDMPAHGEVSEDQYMGSLEDNIYRLVEATGGRTLVLFTSHRTLRETYRRLKARLESLGICLLGHGIDGSRSRILEEFKSDGSTVLFGASSFWEGVDVPGEALSCVVMVKLPFKSPLEPVMEARLEDLARQDRDGFRALSVPQAVIRFKQGFGRLIRNSGDRGCVVILDSRILKKRYGRYFLNSLPLKSHIRGGIDMISDKISDWIKNEYKDGTDIVSTW